MGTGILLAASLGEKLDTTFFGFDTAIYEFFGGLQNAFTLFIAKFFTSFGDSLFVVPIMVLAFALCLFKRTRKYGFALFAAIALGTIMTNLIFKPMGVRIRPYNTLQTTEFWAKFSQWYSAAGSLSESDYSFPSGHTTAAFEIAVSLFLCLKSEKKKGGWALLVAAFFVMCSRIILMVHYPTDVIAGLFVGTLAGILGYLCAKLGLLICEKVKFFDNIDLGKNIKDEEKFKKITTIIIAVVVIVATGLSFYAVLTETDKNICAYDNEYNCMNEAKDDEEKYPAINGKNYCKIHWNELSEA